MFWIEVQGPELVPRVDYSFERDWLSPESPSLANSQKAACKLGLNPPGRNRTKYLDLSKGIGWHGPALTYWSSSTKRALILKLHFANTNEQVIQPHFNNIWWLYTDSHFFQDPFLFTLQWPPYRLLPATKSPKDDLEPTLEGVRKSTRQDASVLLYQIQLCISSLYLANIPNTSLNALFAAKQILMYCVIQFYK